MLEEPSVMVLKEDDAILWLSEAVSWLAGSVFFVDTVDGDGDEVMAAERTFLGMDKEPIALL